MKWLVALLLFLPLAQGLVIGQDATPTAAPHDRGADAAPTAAPHVHSADPDPLATFFPEARYNVPERYAQEYPNKYFGDAEFGVRFECPTLSSTGATGQEVVTTETCPHVLRDLHDILSQPTLMIDPTNPTCLAFHSLHGGRNVHAPGTPQPPSIASRHNGLHQPHTVWRTCRGGDWVDNPYYAPESIQRDGRSVFGEDSASAQDRQGNMYVAGILAYQGPGDPGMQYATYVHHMQRVTQDPNYLDAQIFATESPGATMSDLQMAHVAETNQLVLSWIESTPDVDGEVRHQVRTFYSNDGRSGTWEEVGFSERIGGCSEISELVPYKQLVFVACRPAAGYFAGGNATMLNVQVHAFDSASWTSWHVSQTPLTSGHIKMADADNGWQLLSTSGADPNGRPFAQVTYGALGDRWVEPRDYASEFMRATRTEAENQPLLDAKITAMLHDDSHGLVYMVWALQYEIDPSDPTTLGVNSLAKSFVVIRGYGGGFMASLDLNYGVMSRLVAPQAAYQGTTEQIFWDDHDSIIRWRDPRGGDDQIFLIMGDYGTARFAKVVPEDPPPVPPFPPASIPAVPVLAASASSSALSVAMAAAMGLMLLRLLAAKKKVKVETPTI